MKKEREKEPKKAKPPACELQPPLFFFSRTHARTLGEVPQRSVLPLSGSAFVPTSARARSSQREGIRRYLLLLLPPKKKKKIGEGRRNREAPFFFLIFLDSGESSTGQHRFIPSPQNLVLGNWLCSQGREKGNYFFVCVPLSPVENNRFESKNWALAVEPSIRLWKQFKKCTGTTHKTLKEKCLHDDSQLKKIMKIEPDIGKARRESFASNKLSLFLSRRKLKCQ